MKIYLTNLGKYNEGELVGQWLKLPATDEEILRTQQNILIDGKKYEECFITDYEDSPISIGEYENLDYLNEIAKAYENLTREEQDILTYLLNCYDYDFTKAIEIIKNSDYIILNDIKNEIDLGYALAEDWEIPEHLKNYINYETIGREAIFSGWQIENNVAYYIIY